MSKIIAVDFDGCLCEDRYPEIGKPNWDLINYLNARQLEGDKVILWTCRNGVLLYDAVMWCRKHGFIYDAVNENLPEVIKKYGGDSRKIFADVYIDDKNIIGHNLPFDSSKGKAKGPEIPAWMVKNHICSSAEQLSLFDD